MLRSLSQDSLTRQVHLHVSERMLLFFQCQRGYLLSHIPLKRASLVNDCIHRLQTAFTFRNGATSTVFFFFFRLCVNFGYDRFEHTFFLQLLCCSSTSCHRQNLQATCQTIIGSLFVNSTFNIIQSPPNTLPFQYRFPRLDTLQVLMYLG